MRVYLDNNATTMVDPEAFELMKPFFCEKYALSHPVVALGSAARDHDVVVIARVYARIELIHRAAKRRVRLGAESMKRVWIAVSFAKKRLHKLEGFGIDHRRGIVV